MTDGLLQPAEREAMKSPTFQVRDRIVSSSNGAPGTITDVWTDVRGDQRVAVRWDTGSLSDLLYADQVMHRPPTEEPS
jgi:hypothetical protein